MLGTDPYPVPHPYSAPFSRSLHAPSLTPRSAPNIRDRGMERTAKRFLLVFERDSCQVPWARRGVSSFPSWEEDLTTMYKSGLKIVGLDDVEMVDSDSHRVDLSRICQ